MFTMDTTGHTPQKPREGGAARTNKLPPPGKYKVQICDFKTGTSKNNDPWVIPEYQVVDHPDYEGAIIKDFILIPAPGSPASGIMGRTMHFLKCIGEPYEGSDLSVDPSNWIPRTVYVECFHEEYNGKNYAKVLNYFTEEELGADSGPISPTQTINWND